MKVNQIDKLNIFLILISAVLAYFFPLELFVFAFAILGPLHYLTEINWLKEKGFFILNKHINWLVIGVLASLFIVVPKLYLMFFNTRFDAFFLGIQRWSNSVIFGSLVLAVASQYKLNKYKWFVVFVSIVLGAYYLNGLSLYALLIGILVPTIIHVYVFTLLFMFYGAKKSKSIYGFSSILLAILIPIIYIFVPIDIITYMFDDGLKAIFVENRLHVTPVLFGKFLGLSDGTTFFFYEELELRLMMFISFIYLYHYLNWFSKTTSISWHKNLNNTKIVIIILLWIIMLVLFYIDFSFGFIVALFFSFLHVILEFPLNIKSIRALFR